MAQPTVLQTNIQITGAIDQSLAKAVGLSQQQLKQLLTSVGNINRLANQATPAFAKLPPQIKEASAQANTLNAHFGRTLNLFTLLKGLIIRDIFYGTIRSMERLVDKMGELVVKSDEITREYDKQATALGNLFENQDQGRIEAKRLEEIGRVYGGTELVKIAKQLDAYGVPQKYSVGTVKELATINAGAGGTPESLEALTEKYGAVLTKGYLEKKSAAAFGKIGVPLMDELVKLYGQQDYLSKDGKKLYKAGESAIQGMIKDQMITSRKFQLALLEMTKDTGVFADGMTRYSQTYAGAIDEFKNQTESLMLAFGFVQKEVLTPLLVWFNNSGAWNHAREWLHNLQQLAASMASYFEVVAGPQILARIEPTRKAFEKFFNSIFGEMVEVQDPVNGVRKVMGASMIEKLNEIGEKISIITTRLATIFQSPLWATLFSIKEKLIDPIDNWLFGTLLPFFTGQLNEAIILLSERLHLLFPFIPSLRNSSDPYDSLVKPSDADIEPYDVTKAKERLNSLINTGASQSDIEKAVQDIQDAKDKSYPTSSSGALRGEYYGRNFGEWNRDANWYGSHLLGDKDVALSLDWQKRFPIGSMVDAYDHGKYLGVYRVSDSSFHMEGNRRVPNQNTVEFRDRKIDSRDIELRPHVTINLHAHSMDSHGMARVLNEHAEKIAHAVHRVWQYNKTSHAVV